MAGGNLRTRHEYDSLFYAYQREGSARSARALLPSVTGTLQIGSVLDVGCGAGAWLAAYGELGIDDYIGVDGEYVDRTSLLMDARRFRPVDVGTAFDLGRQFDLVQCLEVGEHVPRLASRTLVDNIVRHGKLVLFSAAVPGQGGEEHVNEQPYEYWRDLFRTREYHLFDFVRPLVGRDRRIEAWYRYNVLFFCHAERIEQLPRSVTATRVPDDARVPDYAPLGYRLRKTIVRSLPTSAVTAMAVVKHKLVVHSLRRR